MILSLRLVIVIYAIFLHADFTARSPYFLVFAGMDMVISNGLSLSIVRKCLILSIFFFIITLITDLK